MLGILKELKDHDDLVDSVNALLRGNNNNNVWTTNELLSIDEDFFDDDRRPAYGCFSLYDNVASSFCRRTTKSLRG